MLLVLLIRFGPKGRDIIDVCECQLAGTPFGPLAVMAQAPCQWPAYAVATRNRVWSNFLEVDKAVESGRDAVVARYGGTYPTGRLAMAIAAFTALAVSLPTVSPRWPA